MQGDYRDRYKLSELNGRSWRSVPSSCLWSVYFWVSSDAVPKEVAVGTNAHIRSATVRPPSERLGYKDLAGSEKNDNSCCVLVFLIGFRARGEAVVQRQDPASPTRGRPEPDRLQAHRRARRRGRARRRTNVGIPDPPASDQSDRHPTHQRQRTSPAQRSEATMSSGGTPMACPTWPYPT